MKIQKLKILAIGDPHGDFNKLRKIPKRKIDAILLTGDIGSSNLMRKMHFANVERKKKGLQPIKYSAKQEKRAFMEAYDSTIKSVKYLKQFAPVYLIFGNVESSNEDTRDKAKEIGLKLPFLYNNLIKMPRVRILNNRVDNLNGIRIGGLNYFLDVSWVEEFKPSNYKMIMRNAKRETKKAEHILKRFGKIDILLCHQPPYGILDKVNSNKAPKHWLGKHAGSKTVLKYIKQKKPKYIFCGHIHEGRGMKKVGETQVYNLGVCGYKLLEIKS